MSDMHDHNQPAQPTEQKPQVTRKIPTVSHEEPDNARRRRSDRVRPVTEQPEAKAVPETVRTQPAVPAQESPAAPETKRPMPAQRGVETRFDLEEQPELPRVVPEPAALQRARQARTAQQMRRMVDAPGYVAQKPLGSERGEAQRTSMFSQSPDRSVESQHVSYRRNAMQKPDGEYVATGRRVSRPEEEPLQPARKPARPLRTKAPAPQRMEPPMAMEDEPEETPRRGLPVLTILAALVLVAALAVLGLLMVPDDSQNILGDLKRAIRGQAQTTAPASLVAMNFTGAPTEGDAPLNISFNLTTNGQVSAVRLVDEEGRDLNASSTRMTDSETLRVWVLNLNVMQPYTGRIIAQLGDGEQWVDSGKSLMLQVSSPMAPAASAVVVLPTPLPTQTAGEDEPLEQILVMGAPTAAPIRTETTPEPTAVAAGELTLIPLENDELVLTNGEDVPADLNDDDLPAYLMPDDEDEDEDEPFTQEVLLPGEEEDPDWPAFTLEELDPDELDMSGFIPAGDDENNTAEPAVTEVPVTTEAPAAVETSQTEVPQTEAPQLVTAAPTPTLAPTATPTIMPKAAATAAPTAIASDEPDATATPAPTATPVPTPTPTPAPTATPVPTVPMENGHIVARAADAKSAKLITTTTVYNNGAKKLTSYNRDLADIIDMPDADHYMLHPFGVITFRGDSFRQNAAFGTVDDPKQMTLLWQQPLGKARADSKTSGDKGYYYGASWNSQPVIVKWSKDVRTNANIVEGKQDKLLKEVILAGLDGKIYFLDLDDGEATRKVIDLGYPMRSTPSIHPYSYPVMTVGQYARKMYGGKTGKIGMRYYNLLNQKEMTMIDGLDGKINRPYNGVGSFETSALMDPVSDSLVTIGSNGMLYVAKMKTEFNLTTCEISVKPEYVTMTSRTKNQTAKSAGKFTAVESSPAMFGSYVFYADVQGVLRCVDTSTLTTIWAAETGDTVEAAIALDQDETGNVWLYTANELANRGKGDVQIRRYNALTGEQSWSLPVKVAKNKKNTFVPGVKASPVIGRNGLNDLVYFTASGITKDGAAQLGGSGEMPSAILAISKTTGKVVWSMGMNAVSYSSPVAVYSESGKGWIIQACSDGTIYLLDGLTGSVVNTLKVKGTIEASPAVYGSTLVIATTGKDTSFVYGISLE